MSWDWVPGKGEPLYFWPPCSVSLALVQTSTVLVAASLHPQERQSTLWKVLVSYSESWVNPYKLSSHFHSHLNAQVPDKHLGLFLSLALLEKCLRWTICWDSPPDIAFQVYQLCSPHQGQFCYWKKKGKCQSLSRVWLFVTPWTVAHQAPLSMDSPGKNTGVGCHALLQGILLT